MKESFIKLQVKFSGTVIQVHCTYSTPKCIYFPHFNVIIVICFLILKTFFFCKAVKILEWVHISFSSYQCNGFYFGQWQRNIYSELVKPSKLLKVRYPVILQVLHLMRYHFTYVSIWGHSTHITEKQTEWAMWFFKVLDTGTWNMKLKTSWVKQLEPCLSHSMRSP